MATYTLNKAKEDALKKGEKLPNEVKEEVDRGVVMISEAVKEKYISPYTRR